MCAAFVACVVCIACVVCVVCSILYVAQRSHTYIVHVSYTHKNCTCIIHTHHNHHTLHNHHTQIASHYIWRGTFWADLLSSVPLIIFLVAYPLTDTHQVYAIAQLLRLLRLFRLVRLPTALRCVVCMCGCGVCCVGVCVCVLYAVWVCMCCMLCMCSVCLCTCYPT